MRDPSSLPSSRGVTRGRTRTKELSTPPDRLSTLPETTSRVFVRLSICAKLSIRWSARARQICRQTPERATRCGVLAYGARYRTDADRRSRGRATTINMPTLIAEILTRATGWQGGHFEHRIITGHFGLVRSSCAAARFRTVDYL